MLRIIPTFFLSFIFVLGTGYPKHALAAAFGYAGLSLTTTPQEMIKRYPNSTFAGHNDFRLSTVDRHDHIYSIELFGAHPNARLRLGFESPERTYPACKEIEKSLVSSYGKPDKVESFNEESGKNRYLIWKAEGQTMYLYCFKLPQDTHYKVEAIAVTPH